MGNDSKKQSQCDTCAYYYYDEEYDCYCCEVNLDEDEVAKFMSYGVYECPYYNPYDEYKIVRRQN